MTNSSFSKWTWRPGNYSAETGDNHHSRCDVMIGRPAQRSFTTRSCVATPVLATRTPPLRLSHLGDEAAICRTHSASSNVTPPTTRTTRASQPCSRHGTETGPPATFPPNPPKKPPRAFATPAPALDCAWWYGSRGMPFSAMPRIIVRTSGWYSSGESCPPAPSASSPQPLPCRLATWRSRFMRMQGKN